MFLESIIFTDDVIVLAFKSDASTQRPGFSIQVRQMTDCGQGTTSKYASLLHIYRILYLRKNNYDFDYA